MTAAGKVEPSVPVNYTAIYDRGFTGVTSVIPPGAPLAPGSRVKPALLGKIPGLPGPNGWYGYDCLREPRPTRNTVEKWQHAGANLGLLGRYHPAIDIDCDDKEVARRVHEVAIRLLGPMPVRYGRQPRCLLACRAEVPLRKQSLSFRYQGKEQKIEILGDGQQYVIEGRHPTGTAYTWEPSGLDRIGPQDLPLLTAKKVEELFDALRAEFGREISQVLRGPSGERAKAPPQELLRGELEEVRAAVASIPNNFPDRDSYIKFGVAIKAALPDNPV
ncbi:MAG: bifunctional DNA primase/polymerase, partial [Gemmatimonadales bacterium]